MSNFKIIGPSNPEVGKEIIYKTSISNFPASLPGQINPVGNNPFTEQVKWSVYILEYGKWVLKEKNNKTGPTANYTFTEVSLKRQGIRIVALLGNEKATLDIKPLDTIERKIVKVELCDALGNLQTKPFAYSQTVLARVHCLNLDNCSVHVTLWEDDAQGAGHNEINKNNKAITKSELVSNGIADVKFKLAPDFAKMADAQLAKGDKSEGKTHEYYVTAEIFRQETKSSNNIDVTKPNNKTADTKATPQKPAAQKPVTKPVAAKPTPPAAKKGQSKKEEKGILETVSGTIYDWGESGFKAIASILPDPMEIINSVAKLDLGKKEDKNGTSCGEKYCIKKDDSSELIREINIRLAGFGGNVPTDKFTDRTEKMIKQFQRDYMKVPETGKVCGNVLVAIDDFSMKFDISNTFWGQIKCSCSTKGRNATSKLKGINEMNACNGFGDHTGKATYKALPHNEANHNYEYPGIHRSLLFGVKALQFYFSKQTVYTMDQVTSGYRCRFKNYKTTNHQGKAIDIQFSKNGVPIRNQVRGNLLKLENIRDDFYIKYLGAQKNWPDKNLFSTEPIDLLYYPDGSVRYDYTFSWLHIDVRQFDSNHLEDKYFCKNSTGLNGKSILQLAKESGFDKTCMCLANKAVVNANSSTNKQGCSCEDKFKKVASIVLKHEGGYVNHPSDKGGPTNKGITQATWNKYALSDTNNEPTLENLKKLTDDDATKIYLKRYWEPKGFCKISDERVSLMIYDWTITSGGAIKQVQKLLVNEFDQKITIDGGIGNETVNSINNIQDQDKLLKRISEVRKEYYTDLTYTKGEKNDQDAFLRGWLDRVDDCLKFKP